MRGVVLAIFSLASCAPRESAGPGALPTVPTPPRLVLSTDQSWTGVSSDDPVVARVNGIPIGRSRLLRAMASTKGDTVLKALIATEAVAQAAVRDAGGAYVPPRASYERIIVRALLDKRFSTITPADFPRQEVEELWAMRQVRARFDHLALYDVMDYQWICCDGTEQGCRSPEVARCFAEGQAAMTRVYALLSTEELDAEDVPLLLPELKPLAPRVNYQEYQFAYDTVARLQKGRSIFDDAVVNAAVETPPGRFSAPTRSAYGWHVLRVRSFQPEEHRDLSDPMVVQQIAEFFLPRWQREALFEFLATLAPARQLPSLAPYFKRREPPEPRYDVAIYADALRAAVEADERRREKNPLESPSGAGVE